MGNSHPAFFVRIRGTTIGGRAGRFFPADARPWSASRTYALTGKGAWQHPFRGKQRGRNANKSAWRRFHQNGVKKLKRADQDCNERESRDDGDGMEPVDNDSRTAPQGPWRCSPAGLMVERERHRRSSWRHRTGYMPQNEI